METAPFQYTEAFIRAGPRKKHKRRLGQGTPSTSILVQSVKDDLISSGWMGECQRLSTTRIIVVSS